MIVRFLTEVKPGALRSPRRAWYAALAVLSLLGPLAGCAPSTRDPVRRQQFLLGTSCSVSIYQPVPDKLFTDLFALVAAIEEKMSVNLPESEVSRVNDAAGAEAVMVSEETFGLIRRGLEFSARTGGAFDITVGPLVKLWGIGTDHARLPAEAEIAEARSLVGYRDAVLEEASRGVLLRRKGMRLDLGAIAKGYAADQAASFLRDRGIRHALLDFGGNIVVVGSHPSRPSWRIGVQDPEESRGIYLGILSVADTSVVTSGAYERYFEQDGVRYHHILDPATGYPVRNGVVSTTVVSASSTTADALSTSLFVLGVEKGLALARSVPGVEAMVITDDKRIHLTEGLRPLFSVTDSAYSLAEE